MVVSEVWLFTNRVQGLDVFIILLEVPASKSTLCSFSVQESNVSDRFTNLVVE